MSLIFILLIIFLIILAEKNSNLTKKLNNMNKNIRFCPNCGYDLNNSKSNITNIEIPKTNNQVINIPIQEKTKVSEKEIKNNTILIVGSVLIILSSIIFLTSTWSLTHNFIKLLILIIIFGVFLLSSYVAKKYLTLEKTSEVFFNISMIYIPIGMFSISAFSLLGEFLSINGDGKNIYLFVSSLLISIIYYFISKKKESKLIAIFGLIFQYLTIIFIINQFTNNFIIHLLGIIIHNIIYSMLYNNNINYYNNELHYKTLKNTSISLSILCGYFALFNIFNLGNIEYIMLYLVTFIHSYYLYSYTIKKDNIFDVIFPITIFMTALNLSAYLDYKYIEILIIISNIIIYGVNYLKYKKIQLISHLFIILSTLILFITTSISNESLLSSITIISYILLNLLDYFSNKNNINSYSLIISSFVFINNIIHVFELPSILNLYVCILVMLVNIFNNKDLKNKIQNISVTYSLILNIIFIFSELDNIYYLLSIPIYYIVMFIYSLINKNELYKLTSYIMLNIFIISLSNIFNLDVSNYALLISIPLILLIEKCLLNNKTKLINNFLLIEFVLSFIYLIFDITNTNLVILGLISFIYILYIKYYNKNKNYYYIMHSSLIPYIYFDNLIIEYNYIYLLSISFIILYILLSFLKKEKIYHILFYIFLVLHLSILEDIPYIGLTIGLIGTYLIYKTNHKDIFKFIMYILGLILYKQILYDINLTDISVLNYGIYILLITLITRTITKKYSKDYRVLEYISLPLLYLITLFNYSSEMDGMLFVFLMLGVVIISYIYKLGPIFIVSLVGILINVFMLTRFFWFNIPWWIYILLIGVILVVFAIRNEMKEENEKFKNKLNNFKDKMDI